jgi:O-acetyl-ADP-ribose deacetylase (regulator of RNase III)
MPVSLTYGDILDLDVDVIVNAANTELKHGGSLAALIAQEGGPAIQAESDAIGWCEIGAAVATPAGRPRARHVVHVPTVDYINARRATPDDVERGAKAALQLARKLGARSIAFPLLGAGIAGLDAADSVRAIKTAASDVHDLDITICAYWQGDWPAVEAAYAAA